MGEAEKTGDCVKVAIRMRPLSKKELGNNEHSIVDLEEMTSSDGNGSVAINDPSGKEKPATFAFDIVFGTDVLQSTVYDCIGKPALNSMFAGYNGTIFAYGQTGSGKSWSMMGGDGDLRGIIPRVNEQLFVSIASQVAEIRTRKYLVMCSFFEIYNEIIFDLLNPCQDRAKLGAGLQIKEHPVLGIYVKDLQEIVVDDAAKLGSLMDSGTKNRAVSSTLMNAVSSRSHSIFTIKVHQKDDEDKSRNVFAKLNLVDLAGSERQKGTGASGQTLKEGANINKSLSALGNVINALVENANGKKVFVPFRNSKLTRVLQESLGGNSLCTMLAALSPAACNFEETLSTLRYANRAKAIKVSATKNEEASQISRLNAEIEELKKKLSEGGGGGGGGGGGLMAEEERHAMKAKFQQQLAEMQQMVSSTWEEKKKLSSDQETQMNKAMEEHKRQQRAMREERRKRFRLLQEQGDLELTIRGLLDTVQALPAPPRLGIPSAPSPSATAADGFGESLPPGPCSDLRSGELLKQWLKAVSGLTTFTTVLKQQSTMAMLFHTALIEDLKLWVEGEENHDRGMARTGARRALTKIDTLRREATKLASVEEEGKKKTFELVQEVSAALEEWQEKGRPALLSQVRADNEVDASPTAGSLPSSEGGTPSLVEVNIEDVGKILELVAQQARSLAAVFGSLASLDIRTTAFLVVRGATIANNGALPDGPDVDCVRMLAESAEDACGSSSSSVVATSTAQEQPTPGNPSAPKADRPLHEWTAADAEDSVEGTQQILLKLLPSLENLNKKKSPAELLARPPPKYVHDVTLLCAQTTGFPPNVSEEWPESREGKLDILEALSSSVCQALGLASLDFDPEHVLKGKEVPKTLKVLQLLAIAAAKSSSGGLATNEAAGGSDGKAVATGAGGKPAPPGQKKDLTPASGLPAVLDSIASCLKGIENRPSQQDGDGGISPTRELESNCRMLQSRIQEEDTTCQRLKDEMEALSRQVEESRVALAARQKELQEVKNKASSVNQRKQELQARLQELRSGLLRRADEIDGNPAIGQKKRELSAAASKSEASMQAKSSLNSDVKQLQQQHIEADTSREKLEHEIKRLKLRMPDGPTIHGSEELLTMQAEKQRWEVNLQGLEEKMRAIAEDDDIERQRETGLMEEKKAQMAKLDDVVMQLQVIIEERDGLRDGNEKLWHEKTRKEEELHDTSLGYNHASERLMEKEEEVSELREQFEKFERLKELLQENFERAKLSPPSAAKVDIVASPPPAHDEDEGSSHYSDDAFEEPDDD